MTARESEMDSVPPVPDSNIRLPEVPDAQEVLNLLSTLMGQFQQWQVESGEQCQQIENQAHLVQQEHSKLGQLRDFLSSQSQEASAQRAETEAALLQVQTRERQLDAQQALVVQELDNLDKAKQQAEAERRQIGERWGSLNEEKSQLADQRRQVEANTAKLETKQVQLGDQQRQHAEAQQELDEAWGKIKLIRETLEADQAAVTVHREQLDALAVTLESQRDEMHQRDSDLTDRQRRQDRECQELASTLR